MLDTAENNYFSLSINLYSKYNTCTIIISCKYLSLPTGVPMKDVSQRPTLPADTKVEPHNIKDSHISIRIFANYKAYGMRGAVEFRIQHEAKPSAVSGTRPHPKCHMPRNLQKSTLSGLL